MRDKRSKQGGIQRRKKRREVESQTTQPGTFPSFHASERQQVRQQQAKGGGTFKGQGPA